MFEKILHYIKKVFNKFQKLSHHFNQKEIEDQFLFIDYEKDIYKKQILI